MEDCFFYIDYKVPEADRKISILCVSCRESEMPDAGWFYEGSKDGFGPFDFKCCLCGKIVHRKEEYRGPEEDEDDEQ